MATSDNQEDGDRPFNLDEVLRNLNEDEHENGDDASAPADGDTNDVSMFCKTCLNPYSGEQKSGTIVLRCERCGQTDTVLEEKASELNPDEWRGNLMMNRFMQVLKEQEDLCLNISDPFFAEDDYQQLSLAIAEYTFNLKAIAEHMYAIAGKTYGKKSGEDETEVETCGAQCTANLGDNIEEALHENRKDVSEESFADANMKNESSIGNSHKDSEVSKIAEIGVNTDIPDTLEGNCSETGAECTVQDTCMKQSVDAVQEEDSDDEYLVPRSTRQHLKQLGPTVVSLMKTLIEKYQLPSDVMEKVEERMNNPDRKSESDSTDENVETEVAGVANGEECVEVFENGKEEEVCNGATGGSSDDVEDGETASNDKETKVENKDNSGTDDSGDEGYTVFNISRKTLHNEIYNALKTTFCLDGSSKPKEATSTEESGVATSEQNTIENADENELEGENVKVADSVSAFTEQLKESVIEKTHDNEIKSTTDENQTEILNTSSNQEDVTTKPYGETPKNFEQEAEVNFYAVSSAFMNELQSRKRKALLARKDKALAMVNKKIIELKDEVGKVEDQVKVELTTAYEKKMKKVENQRKQLDARHKHIEDVEGLLHHYARTGQREKLAALMEQLDIQYEN